MNKYVVISFVVMGVMFYELSGGSDFEPGSNSIVVFADPKLVVTSPEAAPATVARDATNAADLTEIAPARALIEPDVQTPAVDLISKEVEAAVVVAASLTENVPADAQPDLRFVDGDRVNMRGGPGTGYAVVGRLVRNDMVEIIMDEGNGWLHLRDTATGDEGWIADFLVTASN
ncbi:MAG: SH3 domain-containing protein [Marivita sp.]|uniref:SH3 domain-containing protein n=1 Tax=Marivita sp. TaxID=2003365 RepID=UPI003EF9DEC0